jgi:hypothetical protein
MGDTSKIEAMLEKLLAEDREGADELLHEFVVDASRGIYESILEQDLDDEEEVDESDDEEVDEASDDDEEVDEASDDEEVDEDDDDVNENFDLDEFEVEADPADDMMSDVEFGGDDEGEDDMDSMNFGGDDMGDAEDEGEIEDRVVDLEDAIDDLKAEFDKMMGDGGMDDDDDEDEMGFDDEEEDDEEGDDMDFGGDDEEGGEEKEEGYNFESRKNMSATEQMREYVEKINGGGLDNNSVLGTTENGAYTKSPMAGKNDMGGTTANILRTDTEAGVEANKGNLKGSALNDQGKKEDSAGNVNVPGGKAGVKHLKAQPKGHGAEKKGSGDTAPNKKQIIGRKK